MHEMHVEVRKLGDVVIVDLQGRLLAGVGDEILRNVVNELLAEGWRKILLNLSGVTAMDSAGTGELVASLKICGKFDAGLKLLNLHERVRKSLHLSELLPVFEVFDDETVNLKREPFVAGVPEMIDVLVKDIPDSKNGFRLLFSANAFPGHQKKLAWLRGDSGGNYYKLDDPPMEGWICPAMFRYYKTPPQALYVKAEAMRR